MQMRAVADRADTRRGWHAGFGTSKSKVHLLVIGAGWEFSRIDGAASAVALPAAICRVGKLSRAMQRNPLLTGLHSPTPRRPSTRSKSSSTVCSRVNGERQPGDQYHIARG